MSRQAEAYRTNVDPAIPTRRKVVDSNQTVSEELYEVHVADLP